MLELLAAEDIENSPFPHAVKNNILPRELFEKLKADFPSQEDFGNNATYHGGRRDIRKGDKVFEAFVNKTPTWREFFDKVNSPEFLNYHLALFSEYFNKNDIDFRGKFSDSYTYKSLVSKIFGRLGLDKLYEVLLDLRSKVAGNPYYVEFSLFQSKGGYRREIHTDNRHKILVFLIYFDEKRPGAGGDFEMYEYSDNSRTVFDRFPNVGDMKKFASVMPDNNNGVVVLNTNNAYHGVSKFSNIDHWRSTCYISICSKKKFWKGQEGELF